MLSILLFLISTMVCPLAMADDAEGIESLVARQSAFGRTIPQEKVFVHMDNTSYQLGDTIWFSVYTRRTDTDRPSDVSGVLYAELYGQDGYMIERKLIQMHEGHGQGSFSLDKQVQYAGFHELRVYTRWQLNWGMFEHKHSKYMSEQFSNPVLEAEYYRDYEKLYSRVFPVYDKPEIPGVFNHDMTLRSLRRLYKSHAGERKVNVTFFPEGGALVEGLRCRVAFEAAWDDGEWVDGHLHLGSDSFPVLHRGRGVMEITPQKGMERNAWFRTRTGETFKTKLPQAEPSGVSLRMEQDGTGWIARVRNTNDISAEKLAMSVMHEGRLVTHARLEDMATGDGGRLFSIGDSLLTAPGVYQATLFDSQGRVFADRLFFCRGNLEPSPSVSIEGTKEEYLPYELVSLSLKSRTGNSHLSLSVKDDDLRDYVFDSGNILTEMLLSSEIRGFVPHPEWYFEADDTAHRQGLDLLMMTQGWRRFDWQSMAVRGAWEIAQPAEKTPILLGSIYDNEDWFDPELQQEDEEPEPPTDLESEDTKPKDSQSTGAEHRPEYTAKEMLERKKAWEKMRSKKLGNTELKVHAEAVVLGEETGTVSECTTDHRKFRLILPPYYDRFVLFISVADTTKWKDRKTSYAWIQARPYNDDLDNEYIASSRRIRKLTKVEPADHLARISWHYPRFVTPYSHYQNHLPLRPARKTQMTRKQDDGSFLMREVTINSRRHGLQKFNDAWPIVVMDADVAQNMEADMGLDFSRLVVNDYGLDLPASTIFRASEEPGFENIYETRYGYGRTRRLLNGITVPNDSLYSRKYLKSGSFKLTPHGGGGGSNAVLGSDANFHLSPGESKEYMGSGVWDTYVLYSDYSPRMEGDKQYIANKPLTKLVLYPFADGSRRVTYRDRRYVLDGFAYPAQFYSPDYSKQALPEGQEDYRRTLYWNPNLQLDENGEATVTFYNNSRTTHLSIEAEGQAVDGTLLWGREE